MEGFEEEMEQQDSRIEEQEVEPVETTETEEAEVAETVAEPETKKNRESLNEEAEMHRKKRDELNAETKKWKAERDALNAQVRELIDEATKCRDERDSYNQQVRETKDLRDEWNQKISALKEQLAPFRLERNEEKNEVPLKKLKQQLTELEIIQQTRPLGKDKENEIVKQISVLAKQIDEREKAYAENADAYELARQLKECKAEAEKYHKHLAECAEKAQVAHDRMIALYGEADRLRKDADAAQSKFVEYKQAADEEHRKHIEQIKSVHEIDKDSAAYRNKKNATRGKKRSDIEGKKEAKEIFERFKAGERLSTEDLMALQKSGYL